MDIYHIIKLILTIIYITSSLLGFIFLIWWLVMFISRNPDLKKRSNIAKGLLITVIISVFSMFVHFVVAVKQYSGPLDISKLPTFDVSSSDLHDGIWDEKIGAKHGNISPELTWNKVNYANIYAVVMIDHGGNNWLHWISIVDDSNDDDNNNEDDKDLNVTIPSGTYNNIDDGYVGPYPPSGTHSYTIYVFALQGDTYNLNFQLDKGGTDLQSIVDQLNSGVYTDYNNIVAVGIIEGNYSADK